LAAELTGSCAAMAIAIPSKIAVASVNLEIETSLRIGLDRTSVEDTREASRVPCVARNYATTLNGEKILKKVESRSGEHRLRMELHALDGKLAMAQAHDGAIGGLGGDFERLRKRFSLDNK